MTDAVRRGRGRPRDPDADTAILAAALDLFIERGVEGTSIEQVAKNAGVGKLTVYRRWSSKEELIAQAIESARGGIPQPSLADVEGVPLSELIANALPALAKTLADQRFRALIARVFGSSVRRDLPAAAARTTEPQGHAPLPRSRLPAGRAALIGEGMPFPVATRAVF